MNTDVADLILHAIKSVDLPRLDELLAKHPEAVHCPIERYPATLVSPFLDAAMRCRIKDAPAVLSRLLEAGADPNLHDSTETPIICRARSLAVLDLLLTHGANPCIADIGGDTLLHVLFENMPQTGARALEYRHMCERLVASGLSMQQRNQRGETPLLKYAPSEKTSARQIQDTLAWAMSLQGCDLNAYDATGKGLLELGLEVIPDPVVAFLFESGYRARRHPMDTKGCNRSLHWLERPHAQFAIAQRYQDIAAWIGSNEVYRAMTGMIYAVRDEHYASRIEQTLRILKDFTSTSGVDVIKLLFRLRFGSLDIATATLKIFQFDINEVAPAIFAAKEATSLQIWAVEHGADPLRHKWGTMLTSSRLQDPDPLVAALSALARRQEHNALSEAAMLLVKNYPRTCQNNDVKTKLPGRQDFDRSFVLSHEEAATHVITVMKHLENLGHRPPASVCTELHLVPEILRDHLSAVMMREQIESPAAIQPRKPAGQGIV